MPTKPNPSASAGRVVHLPVNKSRPVSAGDVPPKLEVGAIEDNRVRRNV